MSVWSYKLGAAALWAAVLFGFSGRVEAESTPPKDLPQTWETRCDAQKCQIRNYVDVAEGVGVQLLIYEIGGKEVLEFLTPLGIDLSTGVLLVVDQGKLLKSKMISCEMNGCVGFTVLSPNVLQTLKRGALLQVVVKTARSKELYSFDYSLMGFTKEYKRFEAGAGAE